MNIFLLLVLGVGLLGSGIVLPWLIGGVGVAIVSFGPFDNSRLGIWVRENSLLGFVAMMTFLLFLIIGPLMLFDASTRELRNFVFGIILGGSLLIVATVLYTRSSVNED